jgi:ABC-2 type transport system permease protein
VLMSGVIWPVASLPIVLKQLAYVLPLTYAVDALRGVMIRGAGLGGIALDLIVLCGAAILLLAVGTRALGRQAA